VPREKKREREKTKNFRAQFYPTGMSRSAGVFFSLSLFLSFSLFFFLFALKNTLSLNLYYALTQLSRSATCHLSKTVGMQLQLTQKGQAPTTTFQLFLKGG
jgi:hypothetical protein